MTLRVLALRSAVSALLAPALLASGAAIAAAPPPASESSDQLVCDLSGDCGDNSGAPTQDKPDTRGFSIVHAGSAKPAATAPMAPAAPAGHREAAHIASTAAPAPQPGHRRAPTGQVGHANLAIAFMEGSATLTDSGKSSADQFAKALQAPALASKRFMIGGHTNAKGSRPYNQDLSERRAQAVVDYLVSKGAARTQFDVKGFGFDAPLPGSNPAAPSNRRVEIVALP